MSASTLSISFSRVRTRGMWDGVVYGMFEYPGSTKEFIDK